MHVIQHNQNILVKLQAVKSALPLRGVYTALRMPRPNNKHTKAVATERMLWMFDGSLAKCSRPF